MNSKEWRKKVKVGDTLAYTSVGGWLRRMSITYAKNGNLRFEDGDSLDFNSCFSRNKRMFEPMSEGVKERFIIQEREQHIKEILKSKSWSDFTGNQLFDIINIMEAKQ